MEILRNIDQIYGKLDEALDVNYAPLQEQNFAFEILDKEICKTLAEKIKDTEINLSKLQELFALIFQLNNYTPIVCNLCHTFLLAKKYEELYQLVSKIFVAHIGQKYYTSHTTHMPNERSFDRLVEIVYTAQIHNKPFIEFLVCIQKHPQKNYGVWKNPALEYLQTFFVEHENWLLDFVQENEDLKYQTYGAILNFSTAKGVDLLVKDYIHSPNCNKDEVLMLLKNFKRDTILYIDSFLPKASIEEDLKMVEILLEMSNDNEVMTRVQDLYSTTKNPEIKAAISSKLGISETINIRTEKQFLYAARRKIKEPQERSLGVPFDKFDLHTISGEKANNTIFSFIIFLFKEEKNLNNLYKLKILETLLVKEELQVFAQKLFESLQRKGDILQAKWCVRMFALLSSNAVIDSTFDFLTSLLNQSRDKEAKYLISCLIHSHRVEIVDFIKESLEENQRLIRENLDEFVDAISRCLGMHEEDIKDLLVPSEFSVGEFDIQRDRLYTAFIAGKTYPLPLFKKMFLENKIYNKLAGNLVFGEYRFGRVHNAFVLNGNEFNFIVGDTIFLGEPDKDADITIGIIHPLDLDFKFQPAVNYFPFPTFDQFKPAKFSTEDHSISATSVNRFVGVIINPQKFLQYTASHGFIPNKQQGDKEFTSIVNLFPILNIMAEVEFQKPIDETSLFTSLSKVCFYKLSDTMQSQNKYLTQKSNALAIANLPNRYFNHVLSIILEASKM